MSDTRSLEQIVDLNEYAIHRPESADYKTLVEGLKHQLSENQICVLPNFLLEDCRLELVAEVMALQDQGHAARSLRNVYLQRNKTPELPENHSANILAEGRYCMLGAHILPQQSALKTLYHCGYFP